MPCRSADREDPRPLHPRSEHTVDGTAGPTSPATRLPPPPSSANACTGEMRPRNASQKPPIAPASAASIPPEQEANLADNSRATKGGQMIRYGHPTLVWIFYS